jgi:hypothetical protein
MVCAHGGKNPNVLTDKAADGTRHRPGWIDKLQRDERQFIVIGDYGAPQRITSLSLSVLKASSRKRKWQRLSIGALARRKPLVARLAAVINIGGLRLGAAGELSQQIKDLRVAVLRHQPLDVVLPAPSARLTDDRQRRGADVRQDPGSRLEALPGR